MCELFQGNFAPFGALRACTFGPFWPLRRPTFVAWLGHGGPVKGALWAPLTGPLCGLAGPFVALRVPLRLSDHDGTKLILLPYIILCRIKQPSEVSLTPGVYVYRPPTSSAKQQQQIRYSYIASLCKFSKPQKKL